MHGRRLRRITHASGTAAAALWARQTTDGTGTIDAHRAATLAGICRLDTLFTLCETGLRVQPLRGKYVGIL